MYNLQGLMRQGIINISTQFEKLGYISGDVSNMNTNGYKSTRFEQILDENGYLDGAVRRDYRVGMMIRTENPYDVAIDGEAFIPVTSPEGEISYTKDGSFLLNKEGYLITNDGHLVGNGIKVPPNHQGLRIAPDGTVTAVTGGEQVTDRLGKIDLVMFQNPEGLESIGNNKYKASENSGEPILVKKHSYFKQGFVERSNVDTYALINETLRLNASMGACFKLMKVIDDMYSKTINLKNG